VAQPPIDKACGEGILPAGVDALRRLGVRLEAGEGFTLRGIRFVCDGASVEAPFRDACGLALRRTRLHDLMVRRATGLGVRMLWGAKIPNPCEFSDRAWLVGADGQRSRVRRDAHLGDTHSPFTRFGFRRHYRLAPWTDSVEVYWADGYQVYVTPVAPDEIGVALLARDSHLRLDAALGGFPALERRLGAARVNSQERGAAITSRRLRRVFRGRTALIGDASGSVDAITGDGLSLSFLQAHALGDALAAGNLSRYQSEHRRLARKPAIMANALLLLDRFPWLRRAALHALAFEPSIFRHLLALHAAGE
jgi:menaquinone-9 beta-reductase